MGFPLCFTYLYSQDFDIPVVRDMAAIETRFNNISSTDFFAHQKCISFGHLG